MNNNQLLLLKEAAKIKDTVNISICNKLYKVCDGKLFSHLTLLRFCMFINLELGEDEVEILPRNQIRICYMVYVVLNQIRSMVPYSDVWKEAFLKQCNISTATYDKHYLDVTSRDTSEKNKHFKREIDGAFGIDDD